MGRPGAGDSDDIGYGTHCSGSVAGTGQQSDGQYAGMAPDADYETAYDDNVGAHYDRRRALCNVRRFHRSGQGDASEVDAETSISGTVSYGVGPAYEDPIQDPNYFEWKSPPGAGYLEATVAWQPQGQSIRVKVHKDSEEGTVIATGSELVNYGEFTFEAPIDGDRTYVFEVVGEYNVQSKFTMELTALEAEPSAPDGPFGIYRVGVGAPVNAVMSTETHTDVLKYTGLTYGGDDGTDPWYGSMSGTSMSCPVTSGICTLVNAAYRREAGHFLDPIDVLNIVEATAEGGTDAELAGHTEANMGAGFVDAAAAVERARELGRRAGSRGDDETKSDPPQLWNEVDLCDDGRGVAIPDVQGSRADDGSVFTAGQVNHVELTLTDSTHRLSRVRDVIQASWQVVAGDHAKVVEVFDAKYVYFDVDYDSEGETSFDYIVEIPSEIGQYGFGPAEAIAEDGESFVPIPDTEDTNAVVGQEQPDL